MVSGATGVDMSEPKVSLIISLMKASVKNFKDCMKSTSERNELRLKSSLGMEGIIFCGKTTEKPPRWKKYLSYWSEDNVEISENRSNKALLLAKIDNRIMAVTFGYGKSLLKEDCIERNFGLKVALNIVDPNKLRSVNASTVEDMVVTTQRQASYSTSQSEFGLNVTNDILKGVTGVPSDSKYGALVTGKDSLSVSVQMKMEELSEKLKLYYSEYKSDRYKKNGFEWVDNVAEIRDPELIAQLNDLLYDAIKVRNVEHLHIAPPETVNWEKITGFCYSGIRKRVSDEKSYNLNLDILDYIDHIKDGVNIGNKLRTDKLHAMDAEGTKFPVCSIYSALVFQTELDEKHYILCSGSWYQIETSFFKKVDAFVSTVKISELNLPECPADYDEGKYNAEVVANNKADYYLLDRVLFAAEGSPKQIEACDIFTKNKQFVHVKNKAQSAQLSHLFAQGKVSADCFANDFSFRKKIHDKLKAQFGSAIFDPSNRPNSEEFEVVYAIIDTKDSDLNKKLPFFSKVNLMLTVKELEKMHFKCSVCLVKRQS